LLLPQLAKIIFYSIMAPINHRIFKSAFAAKEHILPLRTQGKKLVTTNGCFDLLHAGHIRYLTEAASLGDILVVGINNDASVKKLKGPMRPLQNENDRALIIASLSMVDAVFIFREDDPRAFLEILRPDVHVKGGDYPNDIIEKPVVEKYGGTVRIVSLYKGFSTSSMVSKIRSAGG
jgi:rfaE bifunctional protein nucleotidyltransferase chain/domain